LNHLGRKESPGRSWRGRRRHFRRPRYNARPEASIEKDRDLPAARRAEERQIEIAVVAHERAIAARAGGRFAAAERDCRRALAGYVAAEGVRHPDVANALVELAATLEARDRPDAATTALRRALAILRAPTDDPDLVRLRLQARIALAGLDRARGAYAHAERGFQAALAEVRRRLPRRDPLHLAVLNNLGVLRKAQGRYAEALRYYRRAEPLLGRRDREARATLEHNLGGSEHARGRYTAAEPHARRAVALRAAARGISHPAWAADVAALAAVVEARGRFAEAAALYRRALAVFDRTLGPRSLEVGLTLAGLAALEQQRERPARARTLYARALPVLEARLGRDHPDVALTINNLAVLERSQDRFARAVVLFRRAAASFARRLGARHPHTALARGNLRAVAAALKRTAPTRR
jgi:tetratricopeptide (TPR) repeat protein